jgi:hypothetical protein
MSEMGQKRKSGDEIATSDLPLTSSGHRGRSENVPKGDIALATHTTKEPTRRQNKKPWTQRIFHARVPELTAIADINLNERHSLRRREDRIR